MMRPKLIFVPLLFIPLVAIAQQVNKTDPVPESHPETLSVNYFALDKLGQPIINLNSQDIEVFDHGRRVKAQVENISEKPLRLMIVFDVSGSVMFADYSTETRDLIDEALPNWIHKGRDSVAMVNFSNQANLDQDFTDDISLIKKSRNYVEMGGRTILFDAIYLSAKHLVYSQPADARKIILLISDGLDTDSDDSAMKTLRYLQDHGITLIALRLEKSQDMSIPFLIMSNPEERRKEKPKLIRKGNEILTRFTKGTNGFLFPLDSKVHLSAAINKISLLITCHYRVSFKPSDANLDANLSDVNIKFHRKEVIQTH